MVASPTILLRSPWLARGFATLVCTLLTACGGGGWSITPAKVTVEIGATQTFTVSAAASTVTAVSWQVLDAGGGSVDSSGHYTAPQAPGVYRVQAQDPADSRYWAIATVTVVARSSVRPAASNTGVPVGTPLQASGPLRLATPGQVIENLDVTGCVEVMAPNVTIRRTRISCDSYYPVRVFDGASLLIEDSEISGEASGGIATSGIAFDHYTARRVNIHGTADGAKAEGYVVIEDSWIHDLWLGDGDHADGVQATGVSDAAATVVIRRNFIDIVNHGRGHGGEPNSCFQIGTEYGSNANWTIDGNWLYGGGWVVHADAGNGGNNRISNNRFGRGRAEVSGQPDYPLYGPIATYGSWADQGNVWDDNGAPL